MILSFVAEVAGFTVNTTLWLHMNEPSMTINQTDDVLYYVEYETQSFPASEQYLQHKIKPAWQPGQPHPSSSLVRARCLLPSPWNTLRKHWEVPTKSSSRYDKVGRVRTGTWTTKPSSFSMSSTMSVTRRRQKTWVRCHSDCRAQRLANNTQL